VTLTDRTITSLRHLHDHLAGVVSGLTDEQLALHGGAAEWTVATTLSHMGSGSEINRYVVLRAVGEDDGYPANDEVWDRWNALPPAQQAAGFVEHSDAIVTTLEGLTEDQRTGTMVDLGFLPQPVPLGTVLGMRINEIALHGWDVEVAFDAGAQLSEESARLVLEHLASTMTFLLGFTGKPDLAPTRLAIGGTHTLVVGDDGIRIAEGVTDPSATFEGPIEAAVRLLAGRLAPEHTPAGTTVSGNVTLDQLRHAFPGY
jgi:uncharacterized protein (TIGR03083 family)